MVGVIPVPDKNGLNSRLGLGLGLGVGLMRIDPRSSRKTRSCSVEMTPQREYGDREHSRRMFKTSFEAVFRRINESASNSNTNSSGGVGIAKRDKEKEKDRAGTPSSSSSSNVHRNRLSFLAPSTSPEAEITSGVSNIPPTTPSNSNINSSLSSNPNHSIRKSTTVLGPRSSLIRTPLRALASLPPLVDLAANANARIKSNKKLLMT